MSHSMPTTSTYLDGVILVVNVVPDLAIVIDSPGCGLERTDKIGLRHDVYSTVTLPGMNARLINSMVRFPDITLGTEPKVVAAAKEINTNNNPSAIMVTANSTIELTGEYHEMTCRRLSAEFGKPVFSFPSRSISGDFLDGISDALKAVAGHVPLSPAPIPGNVAIVGAPFERNEMDCHANLNELKRMLAGLGLTTCATLPSGVPFNDYRLLSSAELVIGLPYGHEAAAELAQRLAVPMLPLELPVGMSGSAHWLRKVAEATGRHEEAERFIQAELQDLLRRVQRVVRTMFFGKRLLLALDPYLARALVPALAELGFEVVDLMLRTRAAWRVTETSSMFESAGLRFPISFDTRLPELNQTWSSAIASGVDLIIATTLERAALEDGSVAYLEMGFPSYLRHALFDAPWLGFRGMLWLCDRMYNTMSENKYIVNAKT